MMDFCATRPILLTDRTRIDDLYAKYGHGDSAHAFPSLYLWQRDMGLALALRESVYTVRCHWKGEGAWFFPVGSDAEKAACIEALLENGLQSFCYVTEADAEFLEQRFPGAFRISEVPGDSEYLYDRREMFEMPGKRFEKIRNLYRRLEREHTITAQVITKSTLGAAQSVEAAWQPRSDTRRTFQEHGAIECMLQDCMTLGMRGVLLMLDATPWAVAAGYPLTDTVFDCCLMKARKNLPGVTEHVRAALAQSLPENIKTVNLEEDLGLEGLRCTKTRFRPIGSVRMFKGDRR